ncbi:MAG: hypothetical protein EBW74_09900, partial [Betaproteobacteria bacterium]|nr:hypothetical protein [Betaproteobacteria bacterium]
MPLQPRDIVENRPGAGGTIAAAEIARAPADGQHFLVGFNGPLATAHLLYPKLSYHPLRDLKPVVLTVSQPHVLVVPAQSEHAASDLGHFVSTTKRYPGRFQYASVGNATASHLTMELFKAEAGFFMLHIPYQGGPAAVLATLQDQVQALFTAYVNVQAQVQQGRLRLLGQAQQNASPALAGIPRFADLGFPRVNAPLFNAVAAPAATPDALVETMNAQINAVLAEATLKEALEEERVRREGLLSRLTVTEDDLASNDKFAQVLRLMGVEPPMKKKKPTPVTPNPEGMTYAFAKNDALFQALLNSDNEDIATLCEARLAVKSTLMRT